MNHESKSGPQLGVPLGSGALSKAFSIYRERASNALSYAEWEIAKVELADALLKHLGEPCPDQFRHPALRKG